MQDAADAQVLVIGAGPSGLFAALELARHGVAARLVEREPRPHHQARATAVQPGTLEILDQAGVAGQFLTAATQVRFARVFDPGLGCLAEMAFAGSGCRWEFQCSLPQWRTEEILAARLAELGGSVERGTTVLAVTERDDDVLVRLQRAGAEPETLAARWVIGAGGAHSVTRASMSDELSGSTYPGTALAADIAVSCGLPRDGSALIAAADGYVMLAPLPGERWITFVGDLSEQEERRLENDHTVSAVAAVINARVGSRAVCVDDVAWAAPFRMHRRLASRLADERRFLVGDAGHLSSPFGGEGLNSGLHDAHNLAWKLALQERGQAGPDLLATFASEREAADRHVLATSDRLHALAYGAVQSASTGVRPAPPTPEAMARLVRARGMLDVSYPGSPLSGECLGPGQPGVPAAPAPGDRYPDRIALAGTAHHLLVFGAAPDEAAAAQLARLRSRWRGLVEVTQVRGDARRAGLASTGLSSARSASAGLTSARLTSAGLTSAAAVLVRPDGQIGFRAAPADQAGLAALDDHLSSYLVPAT